jgi:predicted GNAT family N-acyltransferase
MIRAADDRIAGYFTLSSASIPASHLPAETARKLKLPRYPYLPATLLGRLAVDLSFRGLRLGELLLMDALRRALATSSEVASQFVIVDAKDGSTSEFYLRYGFLAFPETSRRLFLPMSTIEALFSPPPAPKSR